MNNLGTVATLILEHVRRLGEMHDDLAAFHAPSECYGDVSRGLARARVELFRQIEDRTGYTPQELADELENRCSYKFLAGTGIIHIVDDEIEARRELERSRQGRKYTLRTFVKPRLPSGMSGAEIALENQQLDERRRRMEEYRRRREEAA